MDVREKLVELIFDSLCRHIDKSCNLAENIADDLISNGVTVQEWIPVKDHPKGKGCYIVSVNHWVDGKPASRGRIGMVATGFPAIRSWN